MNKYIIVGKGASGKDWLQTKMIEKGYKPMKQYTTRPIRDYETGDEYHFISDDEFKYMDDRGKFVSSNFYYIGWYGISISELMNCDVAILSPANIKDIFEKTYPEYRSMFNIIYLDIPIEVRRSRLANRYTNKVDDDNERRISADEQDFKEFCDWDTRFDDEKSINNFVNNLFQITSSEK